MLLEGSCHCKRVTFTVESNTVCPFMPCECTTCRKTQGPSNPNLGADARTLQVLTGQESLKVYRKRNDDGNLSAHERNFCGECGTHLWAFNPAWPELLHPVASAIDTPLPAPPVTVHIMTEFCASWRQLPEPSDSVKLFTGYPDKSIDQWHKDNGMYGWSPDTATGGGGASAANE